MPLFDREDVKLRLEAMKLSQRTLQQVMTISAGGLVLYFAYIAKASFLDTPRVLGALVVVSWVISLCTAVLAHYFHRSLFLGLHRVSDVESHMAALKEHADRTQREMHTTMDLAELLRRSDAFFAEQKRTIDTLFKEFEISFFPLQKRTMRLMQVSLFALVLGFVWLATAYVVWMLKA